MFAKACKIMAHITVVLAFVMIPLNIAAFAATEEDKAIQLKIAELINRGENKFYITVRGGDVTLGGHVDSEAERIDAVKKTKSVKGVKSVTDHIRVLTEDEKKSLAGEAINDSLLTAQVKSKIMLQQGFNAFSIHVNTVDGIVLLTGQLDNPEQVTLAEKAAWEVLGVKGVDNRLVVKGK